VELLLQQIANGLVVGSTYAVVAIGFALVFTVMRVVNLAHPDIMMLATFLVIGMTTAFSDNLFVVVPSVLVAGMLAGLLIERGILRQLRGRALLMPMIGTAWPGLSALIREHFRR